MAKLLRAVFHDRDKLVHICLHELLFRGLNRLATHYYESIMVVFFDCIDLFASFYLTHSILFLCFSAAIMRGPLRTHSDVHRLILRHEMCLLLLYDRRLSNTLSLRFSRSAPDCTTTLQHISILVEWLHLLGSWRSILKTDIRAGAGSVVFYRLVVNRSTNVNGVRNIAIGQFLARKLLNTRPVLLLGVKLLSFLC